MDTEKSEDLVWLRSVAGELATATLRGLDERLAWYRALPPEHRSAIGLIAQSGITSFINWYEDPTTETWRAADIFSSGPKELMRSVSLQQTLQLVEVVVDVTQARFVGIGSSNQVRMAFLQYSRDVAFAAANVYAKAAEARGLWDARLEALVVDSVMSGEFDEELPSRVSAVGWISRGAVSVVVGQAPTNVDMDAIRKAGNHAGFDVLIGVQGRRLVIILGLAESDETDAPSPSAQAETTHSFLAMATSLKSHFGRGVIVVGPSAPSLLDASRTAKAALAGFAVAAARPGMKSPLLADDLLPERALAGDQIAKSTLIADYYRPLAEQSADLLSTLQTYFTEGRSLEATARSLFVHPNTVRYRLKRVGEVLHVDPTDPRTGFVLQSALVLGMIGHKSRKRATL